MLLLTFNSLRLSPSAVIPWAAFAAAGLAATGDTAVEILRSVL